MAKFYLKTQNENLSLVQSGRKRIGEIKTSNKGGWIALINYEGKRFIVRAETRAQTFSDAVLEMNNYSAQLDGYVDLADSIEKQNARVMKQAQEWRALGLGYKIKRGPKLRTE